MALKSQSGSTEQGAANQDGVLNRSKSIHSVQTTQGSVSGTSKKHQLIIGILSVLCLALPAVTYFATKPETVAADKIKSAVEAFGTVEKQQTIGSMTANVVRTDNGQAIVYSTNDGKNLIMGDVYDLNGKPLFDKLLSEVYNIPMGDNPVAAGAGTGIGQVLGEYTGDVPEAFTYLESLGGYKEDPSKSPADTVYVIYDPRCPYCHEFFRKTRGIDLKAKGVTIKWLPTTALGQADPGSDVEKLAAKGLHIQNAEEFEKTFGQNPDTPDIIVTDEDRAKLSENLAMLFGSTEELYGPNAPKAVPTAFYLDKQAGLPRLLAGPNEDTAFKTIFGE